MNEGLTENSAINVREGNGVDSFDDQLRGAFVRTCRGRDFLRGVNLGEDASLSSYVEDSFPELGPRASGDPGVEPGSAPLVNAEQGSMGAGAGAAAAIENEPSPRRAAIEKAQAELRREVAVRDERRRELEFLEKGGELLEFFSAGDFALPPSSPTDPLADQLLSSEGVGGYASIASANGNSVENSVGTSFCVGRSSEGGDDFYAGEDVVNAVIEPLASWEGKGRATRTGSTSLRSSNDLKRESEGSGGGRAVGKSQAYSRRNRPRSNRFGNGHPPTKDADNSVAYGAVNEVRETSSPPVIPKEVTEQNESAVDKSSHTLPASGQLNYSSTQAEPVSTKVKEDIDVSPTPPGKSPEQTPVSQVSTVDDVAETGKNYQGYELAPGSFGTLPHKNDQEAHVCTETVLKDQVGLVGDVEKVHETSLSPRTERNVDFKEVGDVSEPSDQVLGKNQAAPEKACALPSMVMDESTIVMVKDESLGSQTSKNDCKDKPTILAAESKGDRVVDRNTVIRKHVPDSTLIHTIDDKTSVLREVSCTVQLTPKNLEPSENKSNPPRKATSTASSGTKGQSQSDKAVVADRLPVAQVEVKVEEGLSQVGTRLSVVDSQLESGHDVKSIYLVSLPQEEIKTESQSTPVSAGSNRTGFRTPSSNTASVNKFPGVVLPWEKERDPNVRAEAERHKADLSAKARKAHEDYILEEAEIIKNTSKETAEWAKRSPFPELTRRKSHWEYVLQEMAWMANDFMQERLWKLAAASQFSRWIAQQRSQSDFEKAEIKRRQKRVARVLANAVNEFWRVVESKMYRDNSLAVTSVQSQGQDISGLQKDENEAVPMDVDIPATGEGLQKELEKQGLLTRKSLPVQSYAFRFLKDAMGNDMATQAEAPSTPERMSEASSVLDTLWEDLFPEQPTFYTVPEGALQAYRTLVETERTALEIEHAQNIKEHVAALAEAEAQAMADGAASSEINGSLPVDECQPLTFLSQQMKVLRGENEELREQYMPNALSSIAKKKRKNILKSGATKSEGLPSPAVPQRPPTVPALDSTGAVPSPLVTGKRSVIVGPGNVSGNIGSIPTKRMRSAPTGRQRVLGTASPSAFPSPAGAPPKTTFPGGALNQEEVRTVGDETVISRSEADITPPGLKNGLGSGGPNSSVGSKSKKKKKTKQFSGTLGSSLKGDGTVSVTTSSSLKPSESEHRSVFDQLKRKGDHNHTSSVEPDTGGIGSSADTAETPNSQGQPPAKKLKVSKQPSELNVEAGTTTATQAGSLAANTSTSKLLRQNSNRDRNRKTKSAKVPVSQPSGVGVPWTTIEDQAIFALVHDLGHNWELVSDVLSSSSQLKGIFRKPKQCKERYRSLMDRMAVGGEGGDSPEDPSTSQPHPASLPGIPKGAARMVLQRIQGPMEEDTLKVHLENIVRVAQKFRALQPQNEEQKVLVQPHASHLNVVAQICPNGYPTPLDLCEITAATPELGGPTYQMSGSHLSGVMPPVSGMRPSSNGIPVLPGNNNLHTGVPPAPPTSTAATAARDVHRLAAIRPFSPEDAQRLRYQRAVAAGRALPVVGATSTAGLAMMGLPGSSDCPVPLLGPGNNVTMMGGIGRGMSLTRPGLPGMGSPGVSGISPPSLGTVLPSGGVGIVSSGPAVGQTGVPQQVNLMRRSRESPLVRARSSEEQRRLIEELKLQAAQGNTQAASALSNLGSEMLAVQGQQLQHLQHQSQQQQQQYLAAARMAKERQQMQQKQRMLQQQLQQPTALQPQMQSQMQQQQMHSMSQQHVLPQQSHLSQQQHLLSQQQHNMQKQQSQPGSQQSGTLSSPSLQPTAVPSMQSNHQAHQNLLPPQQPSSLGQVPQLPVQSKLQPPRQLQKNPNLRQPSQAVQQQPPRGSKGVVRGNMLMQGLAVSGPSVVPGSVPQGNHHQQAGGQQISHPIQGSRHLMPLAKPISQTSPPVMTGQPGFMQAQQNQSMSGSVPGQQKVVSQQQPQVGNLPSQQLQPSVSPNLLAGQQQQSPTASLPAQQQTSPPAQQSQQMQQQQRRSVQTQMQSAQRRVQQRQSGVSVGAPMIGQLVKNGSPSHPGQVPAQLPHPGGGTYVQGSNMAGPVSLGAGPGASGLPTSGSPSSTSVHSTAWKPGQQSVPPMTTGFYNLSRSGSPGSAQLPSGVSSSGIHLASSNGNSGISVSNSGSHGVNTGLSQPLQVGSSSHASKIALIPGASSRVVSPTLSAGSQRPAQHHGGLPTSSSVSATPAGMMPVSALGAAVAGGVPSSGPMPYQANTVSAPSHSTSMTSAIHMFTVQPRQTHGSVAMPTPAVSSKPPGASVISQTSTSSASSPAAVISPSPAASTSVAESTPP